VFENTGGGGTQKDRVEEFFLLAEIDSDEPRLLHPDTMMPIVNYSGTIQNTV
jgi:hypothetical protein